MASLHWLLPYMVRHRLCLTHLQWKMLEGYSQMLADVWCFIAVLSCALCFLQLAGKHPPFVGCFGSCYEVPTSNETLHSWPWIYITGKRIMSKDASFFTAAHEAYILTPNSATTHKKRLQQPYAAIIKEIKYCRTEGKAAQCRRTIRHMDHSSR